MEFHCLGILFSLNLMLMTAHSALPPELYWERMLPNTPMPKTILELLNLGVENTENMQPHIVEWGKSELPFYNYKGAMKSQETHSQDDVPFYYYKGAMKNQETHSQDDVPFYYYKGAMKPFYNYKGAVETQETHSQDDVPFYYYKGAMETQETHSQDDVPFYYYKGATENQETHSQDDVPFYYYKGAMKPFYNYKGAMETQETHSQDDVPFYYYKGATENQETHSQDDVPFYYYKGAMKPFYNYKGAMETQETHSQDDVPFYYYKGAMKPFYNYKGAMETQETHSQDDVPFYYYKGAMKPFYYYKGATENQETHSQDDVPFYYYKGSNHLSNANHHHHHHLHDTANADIIFNEEDLRPGMKLDAHFSKKNYTTPLLPRQVAQHIPFSLEKKREILETLLVKPEDAEIVETTISICEAPAVSGEEKHCETSLESMVDFVISKLGNKNVQVISAEVEKDIKPQKFFVKDGVKKIAEDNNVVACHPMNYPYAVFYCHHLLDSTTAHFIPLEGEEDGARVKAVALCHKDTSEWNPNHVAFQVLKGKPGDPVCHILDQGSLVWFKK